MTRDRRLRESENFDEVADAELIVLDEVQNTESSRVRERPKHEINRCFGAGRHRGDIRVGGLQQKRVTAM